LPIAGLNCFFFRATVSDLPDLHRTRHRKARLLVRQRARLMPHVELADALAVKLQLAVERLDDLIAALEQEIRSSDMVTEDDRQMIWETLDRMERIGRELLEPLGSRRGPVRALVDERTLHPRSRPAQASPCRQGPCLGAGRRRGSSCAPCSGSRPGHQRSTRPSHPTETGTTRQHQP
jgi:hypothetical protein